MFDAVDEQGVYWTRRRKRNLRVCRDNWIVLLSSGLVLGALLFLWLQYAILPAARQLRVYRRAVSTACLVKPFVLDPNTTWTVCDESNPAASAAEAAASYCVDVWMDLEWTTSETVTQHALVFFARYRVYPIWDPERQDDVYVLRTLRDVENKAHANTPIQPGSSGWWCSIDPAVEPASTTEQVMDCVTDRVTHRSCARRVCDACSSVFVCRPCISESRRNRATATWSDTACLP